mmetsp:Transcript_157981/g.291269  ORF Transcript_157981/g.291269 Transcript_157981/m.291269 type:complete len:248 (-) Transcript_157981:19-762(-)
MSPFEVNNMIPVLLASRRPTGKMRRPSSGTPKPVRVLRMFSSMLGSVVHTTPTGLLNLRYRCGPSSSSVHATGFPSSVTLLPFRSVRPMVVGLPFTSSRPSLMSLSTSRLLCVARSARVTSKPLLFLILPTSLACDTVGCAILADLPLRRGRELTRVGLCIPEADGRNAAAGFNLTRSFANMCSAQNFMCSIDISLSESGCELGVMSIQFPTCKSVEDCDAFPQDRHASMRPILCMTIALERKTQVN